jgi:REP element-mobilizing transposase RayT
MMLPHPKRKSTRLGEYDYSRSGWYFITVCTKNRTKWFGDVVNGEMVLNAYGKIARDRWLWLARQYDYLKLDEFIVMPNHMHGIMVIENSIIRSSRDNPRVVPTVPMAIYNRRYNSLSKSVNAYKTTSSKLIHQDGLMDFIWQRSFYDHIIRDEESLGSIREYIINNPMKWDRDRNNPENLFM